MCAQLARLHGVIDPLVALRSYIELGAKWAVVHLTLGALIHQRALGARERLRLGIAFNKVLANFGANELKEKAKVPHDGVVAQDGMVFLHQIPQAQQHQQAGPDQPPQAFAGGRQGVQRYAQHQCRNNKRAIAQGQTSQKATHCRYSHGRVW